MALSAVIVENVDGQIFMVTSRRQRNAACRRVDNRPPTAGKSSFGPNVRNPELLAASDIFRVRADITFLVSGNSYQFTRCREASDLLRSADSKASRSTQIFNENAPVALLEVKEIVIY
jgi:hypothetical protein